MTNMVETGRKLTAKQYKREKHSLRNKQNSLERDGKALL